MFGFLCFACLSPFGFGQVPVDADHMRWAFFSPTAVKTLSCHLGRSQIIVASKLPQYSTYFHAPKPGQRGDAKPHDVLVPSYHTSTIGSTNNVPCSNSSNCSCHIAHPAVFEGNKHRFSNSWSSWPQHPHYHQLGPTMRQWFCHGIHPS